MWWQWFLPNALRQFLLHTSEFLLILSLFLSLAYACGWLHRLVWYLAEQELSKACNRTPVTIGSLRMDLLRGRYWASNVIIHSPRRHEWKWESPVLARVGQAYVEANVVLCLLSLFCMREELPTDVYTIQVSDIQVFVERRQQFFNFYLLDPKVELPDPETLAEMCDGEKQAELNSEQQTPPQQCDDTTNDNPTSQQHQEEEQKAQQLLEDMLRALGRAAREGSLQGALVEHRQSITSSLKALQTTTKKSTAMQQGVKMVQNVSKAVVHKTQTVQQVVQPSRKEASPDDRIVYVRVGRIQIRDARLFTRDHQWQSPSLGLQEQSPTNSGSNNSWNKPIVIQKVDVRASELCPSLSKFDENELPAVYQPIDKVLEVVWKRVLAEGAKTNTGRLLKTAVGEVFDYWIQD